MEGGGAYVSVEINVSYMKPVTEHETIDIHTRVTKRGKKIGFIEATILNCHGDLVATGKQTAAIIDDSSVAHLEGVEKKCADMIEFRKRNATNIID